MSLLRWRVRPYDAPLTRPLETGAGAFDRRAGFFLAAEDDTHRGLGEAAPLPAWGSETLDACREALAALETATLPAPDPEAVAEALAAAGLDRRRTPAAYAAAELALLDLLARRAGIPLAALLGGACREAVPVNALVGAQAPEAAAQEARRAIEAGHAAIKLKVGVRAIAEDLARLGSVRAAIGDAPLRLDANGTWRREEAIAALRAFAPFSPAYVEQPVAAADHAGLAMVGAESGVTVAADEAVRSFEDAEALLALGVRVLILKPMAQGGLLAARAIAEAAAARGATVVLTSSLDRGVATAGVLHLAAALPALAPAGLATAGLFAEGPALEGLLPVAGSLAVPTGPGLGLAPVDALLGGW